MNTEHFSKLIDNYIEKYDFLNDKEHDEIYKWIAVYHFQKKWNIDAENFGEMFKEAMSKSSVLIDGSRVQPSTGITYLCRQSKEIEEEVRNAFKKLIVDDSGNLKMRQDKIETFVETINKLLQKVAYGKWKYDQDRRATMTYLTFINPKDNYLFKATEVKQYADCIEFGDDIGSGQNFNMKNYYRMCDELVEKIRNNETLLQLLDKELRRNVNDEIDESIVDMPGKLNILAYDIIYCGSAYNLYNGIQIKSRAKNPSKEQREIIRKSRIEELNTKIEELSEQYLLYKTEYDNLGLGNIEGNAVKHIKFGEGEIVSHNGNYLKVEFSGEVKQFLLPDAFAKGFLKTDNVNIVEKCISMADITKRQNRLSTEIRMLRYELEQL